MLKRGKGFVALEFRKSLYPEESLDSAIRSFSGVCEIKARSTGGYFMVEFRGKDRSDLEGIALEFSSHLLSAARSGRMRGH